MAKAVPRTFNFTAFGRVWLMSLFELTLLLILVPVIFNGSIAIPDEGVYNAQARALAAGAWQTQRPAPDLIPDTPPANVIFDPVGPSLLTGDLRVPYGRHPLYSVVAAGAYRIGSATGLIILSIIGTVIASALIGLSARELGLKYSGFATLIAGLGTSLIFSTYLASAHTLAVAASSALFFGLIVAICRRHARWPYVLVVSGAFLGPMLRSESAVLVAALCISLFLVFVRRVTARRLNSWRIFCLAIAIGTGGLVGWIVDTKWTRGIIGAYGRQYVSPVDAVGGANTSLPKSLWVGLLQPWFHVDEASSSVVIGSALFISVIVIARFMPRRYDLLQTLAVAVMVAFVVSLFTTDSLVTGLFVSSPILWLGWLILLSPTRWSGTEGVLLLVTLMCVFMLGLTIYADGGSTQWGGRLFQVLLPPLVLLAASSGERLVENLGIVRSRRLLIVVPMLIGVASMAVIGLRANRERRSSAAAFTAVIREDIWMAKRRGFEGVVVYNPVPFTGAARAFWEDDLDLNLLVVPFPVLREFIASAVEGEGASVKILTESPLGGLESLLRDISASESMVVVDGYGLGIGGLNTFIVTSGER